MASLIIASFVIDLENYIVRVWTFGLFIMNHPLWPIILLLNIFNNNVGGNTESMLARIKGIIKINAMDPES